jgi:hypothetical protein
VRRTAWTLRALRNFASAVSRLEIKSIRKLELTAEEYEEATLCLVRMAQWESFNEEWNILERGGQLNHKNSLL